MYLHLLVQHESLKMARVELVELVDHFKDKTVTNSASKCRQEIIRVDISRKCLWKACRRKRKGGKVPIRNTHPVDSEVSEKIVCI